MDKKKILSNTVMFILIVGFISLFQMIFGKDNTLIGVTIITLALVLLERNLTINPIKNLFKLLTINLGTLVFAMAANYNVWLGLFINFLSLFIIGYLFSYNLRKSIVVPFGLQYLFILFSPVYGQSLNKRIISLIFGSFFIMILQYLFNKDKVYKSGVKIINKLVEDISLKIKCLKENKDYTSIDLDIKNSINDLKKLIYDKRFNNFHLTLDGKLLTDILFSLERISILLTNLSKECKEENYYTYLNKINSLLVESTDESFKNIIQEETEFNNNFNLYIYEIVESINYFKKDMKKLLDLDKKNRNYIEKEKIVPQKFKKIFIHKKNLNIDSIKLSYAIRLGIAGAITSFIVCYFKLSEGRWLVYTIFSLIQPYSEMSKRRSKERVEGTLIGILIVFISFALIKNTNLRFLIVLLAGYLNPFAVGYKNLIICVTVSAVASVSISGNTTKFALSRIIFVILGAIISLLINKYVFPYEIKDGNKYLVKTYNDIIKELFYDVHSNMCENSIKSLFLIPAFIEERMELTNFGANCDKEREFIYNQRVLINSIYRYYLLNKKYNFNKEYVISLVNKLKSLLENDSYKNIEINLENKYSKEEKIFILNIIDILNNYENVNKLSSSF
ncbi:FUSC family protein [Clostridium fallax]|uniref:Fusaric acid resistance protein-like n=1 Tax=Clostridium fallax TaxID=1533 RepID=A0A1M4YDD6_9CLOT|nr:FUSC family protein [Clostridium fallax]SHF03476.1 Fusaric acid resistance protein-like [Clostridium fallax]SQB05868.1 membrane protein [Clostridium fallax]